MYSWISLDVKRCHHVKQNHFKASCFPLWQIDIEVIHQLYFWYGLIARVFVPAMKLLLTLCLCVICVHYGHIFSLVLFKETNFFRVVVCMILLTLWKVKVEIKKKPTVDVSELLVHNQETNKILHTTTKSTTVY